MKTTTMLMAAVVALTLARTAAAANDCRAAEEQIAEMSVSVADAYGAGDVDKAKPLLAKAAALGKKGGDEAKACGCDKVAEPLGKADSMMKDALTAGGFNDVQDRLYAVIGQSETARRAAEMCWRERVATPQPKK